MPAGFGRSTAQYTSTRLMSTGSLHSYCTQVARSSESHGDQNAYTGWERSNELPGAKPSFKAEILFSLSMVRLLGTATRAMFKAVPGSSADALAPPSAFNTAALPTPAMNSRRLGPMDNSSCNSSDAIGVPDFRSIAYLKIPKKNSL